MIVICPCLAAAHLVRRFLHSPISVQQWTGGPPAGVL